MKKKVPCPKCKKAVLAIIRNWGTRLKMATVEVHHYEDAERWNHGAATRICTIRMTFEKSQDLMEAIA